MRLFRRTSSIVNFVGGGVVKAGVSLFGSVVARKHEETGEYIKDVGHKVVHASQRVIENTAHLADGMTNSLYGLARKDKQRQVKRLKDMRHASTKMTKRIVSGVVYTGKNFAKQQQERFAGIVIK